MSEDVPRHPELDEALATGGAVRSVMQVYRDWLLEQGHPPKEGHHELLELRSLSCELLCGFVSAVTWDPQLGEWGWALGELSELWSRPIAALCSSLRVNLPHETGEEEILREVLAARPPSVGMVAVGYPQFPLQDGLTGELDLAGLEGPPIRVLHLRVPTLVGFPPLQKVHQLELAAHTAPALGPLPQLTVAHLWDGLPIGVIEGVLRSPRLEILGVHSSSRERVLGWPWEVLSPSVREVWLVGAQGLRLPLPDGIVLRHLADPLPPEVPLVV
jgi:hypothetical protein